MNQAIAIRLLQLLRDGTPGWGSATDGTLQVYLNQLARLPDSEVAEAAIERVIAEWTSNNRPTVAYLLTMYRAENVHKAPVLPPDSGITCYRCDDTEWIECTDDRRHANYCHNPETCYCHALRPCPACVSGNPDTRRGQHPSLAEGRLIASQSYAEECIRQGREPNWETFENWLHGSAPAH